MRPPPGPRQLEHGAPACQAAAGRTQWLVCVRAVHCPNQTHTAELRHRRQQQLQLLPVKVVVWVVAKVQQQPAGTTGCCRVLLHPADDSVGRQAAAVVLPTEG